MSNLKIIALVDCDSFFVACEQLYNPSLLGQPVCVLSNNDGCIISRSKEAKQMGIKMGMPYFMAKTEFPNGVYLSGTYDRYVEISKRVMEALKSFSPTVEQYSIDEAFVDLTGLRKMYRQSYLKIAQMMREEIKSKIGIPVSIGVSTTKTLAKLASHRAKKGDGAHVIGCRAIKDELKNTDLEDVWGIGHNTSAFISKYGIKNAYEFSQQSDEWLKSKLGIRGLQLKHELLGTSVFPIESCSVLPKSIQKTRSFAKFSEDKEFIKNSIIYHINHACFRLRELGMSAGSVRLVIRTKDFKYFTEKKILTAPTSWDTDIIKETIPLLDKIYQKGVLYRSSGVVLENLVKDEDIQMSLFSNIQSIGKKKELSACVDRLAHRYKCPIVKIGYAQSPQND